MKRITLVFIFCILALSGCRSNKVEMPSIQGMIYDGNNEPVSDVEIYINDKKQSISDIYGHFSLIGLNLSKSYSLKASKKNFEDVILTFTYSALSQVIYLRMYSASELLSFAENKVKEKKYNEAEEFLNRAEKAGVGYLSVNYLRACVKFLKADYDTALTILNSIVDEGYIEAYVYLLLADIYETGFSDYEKSKAYLQKSLELSYDPVVEKRLNAR